MNRITRALVTLILYSLIATTTGCFKATSYQYRGNAYTSRAEAESAHQTELAEQLSKSPKANNPVDISVTLIMPTHRYFKKNIKSKGMGPKRDAVDYTITLMQRELAGRYNMIINSGIFSRCEAIDAIESNGEHDSPDIVETYKFVVTIQDNSIGYHIIAPNGQFIEVFEREDLIFSIIYGWDWFSSFMHAAVSQ